MAEQSHFQEGKWVTRLPPQNLPAKPGPILGGAGQPESSMNVIPGEKVTVWKAVGVLSLIV